MQKRDGVRACVAVLTLALTVIAGAIGSNAQTASDAGAAIPLDAPTLGPADAVVTIVEFSDFQCPFCRSVAPLARELVSAYPGKVRYVFRHNPLTFHVNAPLAHEAALAAGAQGKFWEMHDLLFANQRNLGREDLMRYAHQLGLDRTAFQDVLDRHLFLRTVERDRNEATQLGILGTPTFLINGRVYRGALTRREFDLIIAGELRGPSPAGLSDSLPIVDIAQAPMIGTSNADITIVVFADFACPYSRAMAQTLSQLLETYPDRVRLAFKHFPAANNDSSRMAHRLAAAAAEQGLFWTWYERAFALRGDFRSELLIDAAKQVGMNGVAWEPDLLPDRFSALVDRDVAEGRRLGVRGTPTLFINGRKLQGAQPLAVLDGIVANELQTVSFKMQPSAVARRARLARGPADAAVRIVWFSDVKSSLGPPAADLLAKIQRSFPGSVRVEFRHRPLDFHPEAKLAHEALEAAADGGKFWEMLKILHSHQNALAERDLASYADSVGLDGKEFVAALKDGRHRSAVDNDVAEARRLDIRGVPVLFVNNTRIEELPAEHQLRQIVEIELQKATRHSTTPPQSKQ